MARTRITLYADLEETVAYVPGVKAAVGEKALELGVRAEARLQQVRDHTNATDHRIEVSQGKLDAYVSLVGPAPGAVEFGHYMYKSQTNSIEWIEGKHILFYGTGLL